MSYNLKTIKEQFKKQGIFYTPNGLAEKIKSYIQFSPKEVYDPTCGDGTLLSVFGNIKKYGQEINEEQLAVAKLRLSNFNGHCGDTLKSPAFLDKKFECIVANYPFSIEWEPQIDERFINAPTIPTKSKADYAFILHILFMLSQNGIAVTLNFPGILYRGGREGKIRKWLIESNVIEKIVHIDGNTFIDTKISTVIIIFKKNKTTTNITFENGDIEKTISLEEIKKNDYNLSINNYIYEEKKKEVIDPIYLENLAQSQFLNRLKNELNFSKKIAEIEGLDFNVFLNSIENILKNYRT